MRDAQPGLPALTNIFQKPTIMAISRTSSKTSTTQKNGPIAAEELV